MAKRESFEAIHSRLDRHRVRSPSARVPLPGEDEVQVGLKTFLTQPLQTPAACGRRLA